MKIVELENVKKIYSMGDEKVYALKGISFDVEQGEFISIMGPSGSGKSTCMNMIGCLDTPTDGTVRIDGMATDTLNEKQLAVLRNRTIGFVFQQYHLIPSMTVIENVMLPLKYKRVERSARIDLARKALEKVGLQNRENHRSNELSGGQKQRVAIARAIITEPKIILADEPTGALDSQTGIQVMDLFRKINQTGTTIIIVTHDARIGESTERCIKILDGQLC
ncbi:MAG: ABC transporter ATP-binding protein [Treponema sp.]